MHSGERSVWWRIPVLLTLAVTLLVLPESLAGQIRTTVRDGLVPGQIGLTHLRAIFSRLAARWTDAAALTHRAKEAACETEVQDLRTRQRLLQSIALKQSEQALPTQPPLTRGYVPEQNAARLIVPELVSAAVVGTELAARLRAGTLLAEGRGADVRENAWVLDNGAALVDLGNDYGLSPADLVLMGRVVVGKVERVGQWSSTVIRTTDSAFRSRARLVRFTRHGALNGPTGILRGLGDGNAMLEGIDASENVAVGDEVYTADRDGILPTPLYFGRVTEATVQEAAKTWRVVIQPATTPEPLLRVEILRTKLNTQRVAQHERSEKPGGAQR